jgi:methionyl aminopeptidase
MEKEIREKYEKSGHAVSEVLKECKKFIKEDMLYIDVAQKIEDMIRSKGAELAFPANLSPNEFAAHWSPKKNDVSRIPAGCLLKVDLGAHMDGYIADSAITIDFSHDHGDLVKASEEALQAAIDQCYTGSKLSNVSEAVENKIKEFGFNPISNLTGHGLSQFWLHESPSVPNVKTAGNQVLKEGQVLAIEPFATPGKGRVNDSDFVSIFRLEQPRPVRNPDARKIIDFASDLSGLPFSERWLPFDSVFKIRLALRELREKEILYDYHALKEVSGALVSQSEHSLIVSDKPFVYTKHV